MRNFTRDITFSDEMEILHISGPWVGTMNWRGLHIITSVMIDSVVTDIDSKRIYFIRCYMPTNWRKDIYFSLCFIKTDSKQVFEVQNKLPSTALPKITTDNKNHDIVHVQFPKKNLVIDLNECSLISIAAEKL